MSSSAARRGGGAAGQPVDLGAIDRLALERQVHQGVEFGTVDIQQFGFKAG